MHIRLSARGTLSRVVTVTGLMVLAISGTALLNSGAQGVRISGRNSIAGLGQLSALRRHAKALGAVAPTSAIRFEIVLSCGERPSATSSRHQSRESLRRTGRPVDTTRSRSSVATFPGPRGSSSVDVVTTDLSFRIRSTTRIVVVVPPGHGAVRVNITTRAGRSAASSGDRYTCR